MGLAATTPPNPAISSVAAPVDTTQKSGTVFPRLSRRSQQPGTLTATQGFGEFYSPQMFSVPGYLTGYHITLDAGGGTGTVAVASQDGIWAALGQIVLTDIQGTPALTFDGFGAKCVHAFSGQAGALGFGNVESVLPSYTGMQTDGNFHLEFDLPLEFGVDGYCSWPLQNAQALPQLTFSLGSAAQVYATVPTTLPTLSIKVDRPFWMQPQDIEAAPMDVGASHQWKQGAIPSLVPSATYVDDLQFPTVGQFLDTIIFVLRDSTGARIAAWPQNDLQLWVDGVSVLNET
ncbi:MAG: hypothetical protein ACYDC0_16770, partial [Acidimicrobiales bacterium]